MRRGTNPIINIEVNIDVNLVTEGYVTFKQGKTVVEKTISDCSLENNCICVQLEQSETLSFKVGVPVQVQARLKLSDGTVCATEIERLKVEDVLKDGEI